MKTTTIFTKVIFCLAIFGLLSPPKAFCEPVSSDSGKVFPIIERDTTHDTVREYEAELDMLNEDLLRLKADKEWLYLKIFRIQDQNRIVPQDLKESRINLTRKIAVVLKKKERVIQLIRKHRGVIRDLNRKIDPNVGFNSLYSKDLAGYYPIGDPNMNGGDLHHKIAQAGLQNYIEVVQDESGVFLKTASPILFASGSSKVTDPYRSFLRRLASFLAPYEVFINVDGYTDRVKFKDKSMTNMELSAKRAGAVIQVLTKYGMKPSIFKLNGMGQYPLCNENSAHCRILSRRADIRVYFNQT